VGPATKPDGPVRHGTWQLAIYTTLDKYKSDVFCRSAPALMGQICLGEEQIRLPTSCLAITAIRKYLLLFSSRRPGPEV
jgi:hypothetical protein